MDVNSYLRSIKKAIEADDKAKVQKLYNRAELISQNLRSEADMKIFYAVMDKATQFLFK